MTAAHDAPTVVAVIPTMTSKIHNFSWRRIRAVRYFIPRIQLLSCPRRIGISIHRNEISANATTINIRAVLIAQLAPARSTFGRVT